MDCFRAELTRLRFNPKPLRFQTHRTPLQTWVKPPHPSRDSPQPLPNASQTQRERSQTTWEHPQMIRETVQLMREIAQMIPACSQLMRETLRMNPASSQMNWETRQTMRKSSQTIRESSHHITFSPPRVPDVLKQGRRVPKQDRAGCHRNPAGRANVLVEPVNFPISLFASSLAHIGCERVPQVGEGIDGSRKYAPGHFQLSTVHVPRLSCPAIAMARTKSEGTKDSTSANEPRPELRNGLNKFLLA